MISRRRIESMTGGFRVSWAIPWTTSTTGWWRSWEKAIRKRLATIPTPHRCSGASLSVARTCISILCACAMFSAAGRAQTKASPSHASAPSGNKPAARSAPSKTTPTPSGERQLTALARDLHDHPVPAAYDRLAAFARDRAKTTLGRRADLALGYYEFTQNSFSQARTWLDQAAADPLLADYALYWRAVADRADGANAEALEELQRFRRSYPNSVMSDTAVAELAQAALALDQPAVAVEALEAY